jgi:hypothetical protein
MFTPKYYLMVEYSSKISSIFGSIPMWFESKTKRFYCSRISTIRYRTNVALITAITLFMVFRSFEAKLIRGNSKDFNLGFGIALCFVLASVSFQVFFFRIDEGVQFLNQFMNFAEKLKRMK